MKLSDLNKIFFFLIFFITLGSSHAEDEIDIWKKKPSNKTDEALEKQELKISSPLINKNNITTNNIVQEQASAEVDNSLLYGIWDPDKYNFELSMWSNTDGKNIQKTISRLNKLKLSETAENILLNTLFSYSYAPENLSEKDFLNIKINWLIKNKRDDLIEEFLTKNNDFPNKNKIIQYLVDRNISKANIKIGCEKVNFIGKDIKDPYLEKFKIYCLIFNNKKSQAQLLHDILKEQKQSDKFFDNAVNVLLGVSENKNKKIKDDNLLNFYLSSVTFSNFKYEPNDKTNRSIWEYMNSANLITIDDITDKQKIENIEIAANKNQVDKSQIFKIYKKIPFELNSLINAKTVYQSMEKIEGRALIYQKFLLSDNTQNKLDLLFLLKDLFKKDNLSNVYTEFLSDRLEEFDLNEIPENYLNIVERNIVSNKNLNQQKIKFDDKTLHRSKLIRYFYEKDYPIKKTQKELDSIYKKIKRNKNYFYSAKDVAVLESLENDGITIPKEINHKSLSENYNIPDSLNDLAEKGEKGYLALKIVEIIGEDEVNNLDPETIYFITNLLNKLNLTEFRNEILSTALPLRI
ncbi:MAG: hypothetical protein CMI78_01800 [Candidatus Pelagibacter sp.]|nr:hypothetical protein [Candidatus Pelagibacter sp.]OUW67912.1 MAG: hypothetical protein CBD62_02770 [Candidatus Pelagibacter sp. TMED202]|tara:strand:+ start:174 stop:1904 length:1731 start_codon:yes stop_codon:yes gene_type:complete